MPLDVNFKNFIIKKVIMIKNCIFCKNKLLISCHKLVTTAQCTNIQCKVEIKNYPFVYQNIGEEYIFFFASKRINNDIYSIELKKKDSLNFRNHNESIVHINGDHVIRINHYLEPNIDDLENSLFHIMNKILKYNLYK